MRTISALAFLIASSFLAVFGQNQDPIPVISQQLTNYFNFYPKEKVFITTDKQSYKPGETIWFSAILAKTQMPGMQGGDLKVSLYNKDGLTVAGDKFKLNPVNTPGDLDIPVNLSRGQYFLVAYLSPPFDTEEVFCTMLNIDPDYSNQWKVSVTTSDSISIAGKKNELSILLRDLSGDIQKNTQLRYRLMNGKELIVNGKLKTDDSGKAILPFTLPAKSNGEPFIIELTDNKDEWKKEVFLPSTLDPLVINFYPEGGTIVAGISAKIGFTAFNKWGIPMNIEGLVVNQEGKQVGMAKTFTKGMGLFSVENDGKQKLRLVLSGKTGLNQTFDLPIPNASGLAFSVSKTDADFISANLVFADKQKYSIALIATSGSSLNWAASMEINGVGRIKIPIETLPQGINLISIFRSDRKFLAERLVFVDKKQQLKVVVQPDKNNLKQGESMKMKVRLTDENNQPVSGTVSVSIVDSFRKTGTAPQIEEYLLAGPELETPFSLISEAFNGQITNSALMDVFLVTNRLKGFDWQKIMQFKSENATDYNNENNGISGIVTDKDGNKINKAKVSMVNNKNMQILTTTTNQDGLFSFSNLSQTGKEDFTAKATDPEGKRELNIVFNRNFEDRIADYVSKMGLKSKLLNNDQIAEPNYFRNNPDLFIKAPKIIKANTISKDNQQKMLSTSTSLLEVIKTIKPYHLMSNMIVFYGSENSLTHQGGALIVLDGQQLGTDISALSGISPMDVDHINVSTNPMDIQRYTGLNSVGLIEIFSKKAPTFDKAKESTNQYKDGYLVPKVFPVETSNPKRDLRTTLQWIPELNIDATGQTEISVTSGKVLSDFMIEVQGMSTNGKVGSGKAAFTVGK
jgi:hypothetical protein